MPLSAQRPAHPEILISQGSDAKRPPRLPQGVRSSELAGTHRGSISSTMDRNHVAQSCPISFIVIYLIRGFSLDFLEVLPSLFFRI